MNIEFIIPVVEYNVSVKKSLTNVLKTVDKNIIIVASKETCDKINKAIVQPLEANNVAFIHSSETTRAALINAAAASCEAEYFSVLNYEDEYSPNWLRSAMPYMKAFEASVYLPFVELVDNGNIVELGNVVAWSPAFTDTEHLGYIENDGLKVYKMFMGDGAIIKTSDFVGLTDGFYGWHEFLAKTTHNGLKVFVIPKIGYMHPYEEHIDTEEETATLERISKEYIKEAKRK